MAQDSPSIVGVDLVKEVSCSQSYEFKGDLTEGFEWGNRRGKKYTVIAIDSGIKQNILRQLTRHPYRY